MVIHFLLIPLLLILSIPVGAQAPHAPCEKAEHTADLVTCLSKQNDIVQNRLNELFLSIVENHEALDKDIEVLWDVQKGWLAYRDKECQNQVDAEETISLKRVQELKCIQELTEQRIAILELSFPKQDAEIEQSEILPLWMNVVAREYPDVFWDFGQRLQTDLDCDGIDDHAMLGITTKEQSVGVVLTVAKTPETGRAETELFTFDVKSKIPSEQVKFCTPSMSATAVVNSELISLEDQEKDAVKKLCEKQLVIVDHKCRSWLLHSVEESYTLDRNQDHTE